MDTVISLLKLLASFGKLASWND